MSESKLERLEMVLSRIENKLSNAMDNREDEALERDEEPHTPERTTKWWNVTIWCDDVMNANPGLREKERNRIIDWCSQHAAKWAFQLEKTMSGRYHWQMVIMIKHPVTIAVFKKSFYETVELTCFVRGQHAKTFSYATKRGGLMGPYSNERKRMLPVQLRGLKLKPWQDAIRKQCIDAKLETCTVNVLVDYGGGKGKSTLCQLAHAEGWGYALSSKIKPDMISAHMCGVVKAQRWEDENNVHSVLVNVPRGSSQDALWNNLETVKDGMYEEHRYSPKSAGVSNPIMWVFINEDPDLWRLSARRWKLWFINTKEELELFPNQPSDKTDEPNPEKQEEKKEDKKHKSFEERLDEARAQIAARRQAPRMISFMDKIKHAAGFP